jgi:hypothetical protein
LALTARGLRLVSSCESVLRCFVSGPSCSVAPSSAEVRFASVGVGVCATGAPSQGRQRGDCPRARGRRVRCDVISMGPCPEAKTPDARTHARRRTGSKRLDRSVLCPSHVHSGPMSPCPHVPMSPSQVLPSSVGPRFFPPSPLPSPPTCDPREEGRSQKKGAAAGGTKGGVNFWAVQGQPTDGRPLAQAQAPLDGPA